MCQLHISFWNISWVPPETAIGVNHTFFLSCVGHGIKKDGMPKGAREPEADIFTLDPGPAALGFTTTSVSSAGQTVAFSLMSPMFSQHLTQSI